MVGVQQREVLHHEEQRHQGDDDRERHPADEQEVDHPVAGEVVAGQDVGHHRAQQHGADHRAAHHDRRVDRVLADVRLVPGEGPVLPVQPRRQRPGVLQDGAGGLEGVHHRPQQGPEGHHGPQDQEGVREDVEGAAPAVSPGTPAVPAGRAGSGRAGRALGEGRGGLLGVSRAEGGRRFGSGHGWFSRWPVRTRSGPCSARTPSPPRRRSW